MTQTHSETIEYIETQFGGVISFTTRDNGHSHNSNNNNFNDSNGPDKHGGIGKIYFSNNLSVLTNQRTTSFDRGQTIINESQ